MDEVEAFVKSPDESPQNDFKSLPNMSKVLVKFSTGVPASAACEPLFSAGEDVLVPHRTGCLIKTLKCVVSTSDSALTSSL